MGGLNAYQYCPNPVEWVDPLGLSCKEGDTNPISADGVPLSPEKIKEIQEIPKGDRPEPADYLPKSYIEAHLQKFDAGASRFMTASNLNKYGPGQRDGTSFVMPKSEADTLMSQAKGDKLALADSLGLPRTMLDSNELVRVDFNSPRDLGLRMPSGNEAGANEYWIPGGKLPDGASEAIIDVGDIPDSRYTTKTIK
jgi:uncharacterized protein RhaS with RHS repeats